MALGMLLVLNEKDNRGKPITKARAHHMLQYLHDIGFITQGETTCFCCGGTNKARNGRGEEVECYCRGKTQYKVPVEEFNPDHGSPTFYIP